MTEDKRNTTSEIPPIYRGPPTKKVKEPVGPVHGHQTHTILSAASAVSITKNSSIGSTPGGGTGGNTTTVSEPSLAIDNTGQFVFYTGNWFASKSTDYGNTFSYINPYDGMLDFCCDQDVVYDPIRNMFIWLRISRPDQTNFINYIRIGISKNNFSTWIFYNIYTTTVDTSWINSAWDYPQLGLTKNYIYISTNVFNVAVGWARTAMLQISLDSLYSSVSLLNIAYYTSISNFNFGIAQEPPNTSGGSLYFASHFDNAHMTIYKWDETTNTVSNTDVTIPAWTPASSDVVYNGIGPDGNNWCARLDDRLNGGWHSNGEIGFVWTVPQGSGFNYPYINAASFKDTDFSYISRPYIFNTNYAYGYGFTTPNTLGNIGMSLFWGGNTYNPNHAIGIFDTTNNTWSVLTTNTGTNGPFNNSWGDYVRIRGLSDGSFAVSGYTLQGPGTDPTKIDIRYITFITDMCSTPNCYFTVN